MDTKSISSISEFTEWLGELKKGSIMYYRGLSDASWELEASGYRRIKNSSGGNTPTPNDFKNYIGKLVGDAKSKGFGQRNGKNLTDLELLAKLQHNGAATCLIDFTRNPLVALWFACRENPGRKAKREGKVLVMQRDRMNDFAEVTHEKLNDPICAFLSERKLWKWEPRHDNNRIIAQNSVFVFGQEKIEERHYKTINVNKEAKEKIYSELQEQQGIDELYLFGDFTGFSLANAHDKLYRSDSKEHDGRHGMFHQKAIGQYDQVIEIDPENAAAYYARGLAKSDLNDHQGAIADYSKVIEINPKDDAAYYARGLAKSDLNDYEGAIADYSKVIDIDPKDAVAYYARGGAKSDSKDHQGAIADYSKVIEINPKDDAAYYARGLAKSDLNDHQGAIADYSKMINIDPKDAVAYYARGVAKQALGNYQGAIEDYNKAIEINPKLAIKS